jgi:DNA-binding LytR/AlgR family response regulator
MSSRVARLIVQEERNRFRSRIRLLDAGTISVDWGSATSVVRWCDVVSARAVGNHTEIATLAGPVKVHCPLKEIIEVLTSMGLVQLRRNLAVNATRVRRLIGCGQHRLVIVLEDDRCVDVGRQFQRDIRARFGRRSADRFNSSAELWPPVRMGATAMPIR